MILKLSQMPANITPARTPLSNNEDHIQALALQALNNALGTNKKNINDFYSTRHLSVSDYNKAKKEFKRLLNK